MELEYYTDEINLNEMSVTEEVESPIFDDLISKIKIAFNKLNISAENKKVFYKRNNQGKSVIGIQVGKEDDLSSYILFDCSVEGYNGGLFCNVDVHADQRYSQLAGRVINVISSEVCSSFEGLEYHINSEPREPKEVSIMKPIAKKKNSVLSRLFVKRN